MTLSKKKKFQTRGRSTFLRVGRPDERGRVDVRDRPVDEETLERQRSSGKLDPWNNIKDFISPLKRHDLLRVLCS